MKIWWRLRFWNNPAVSNYPGHLVKKTGIRTLTVLHNHDNRESQGFSIYRDGTLCRNSWVILSAAILNNYEISRELGAAIWIITRTHDFFFSSFFTRTQDLIYIQMKRLPIDFLHCNIKMSFSFFKEDGVGFEPRTFWLWST